MAKKIKKYQGDTGSSNVEAFNKAALEKVNAPAVRPYDMDTMYAASKADYDAQYAKDTAKFRSKNRSRFSDTAKKAVKNLASELGRAKVGGPVTALDKVQQMYSKKR